MQIKIPLNLVDGERNYKGLRHTLKQLELSVHHAQKVIENAEKDGIEISEDSYICYKLDYLKDSLSESDINLNDYYDETQNIELEINLS